MGAGPWAGVDVGGRRKGFHLAVTGIDRSVRLARSPSVEACVETLERLAVTVVAIDAPSAWAEPGESSRACERDFARRRLCGIRFTPDEATALARTDRYFEWIEHGIELWSAARAAGLAPIECFPTASWTAWLGPRGRRTRAAWTRDGVAALVDLGVEGLEPVRNQDDRDAAAAVLTARQWVTAPHTVDVCGGLIVPQRATFTVAAGV